MSDISIIQKEFDAECMNHNILLAEIEDAKQNLEQSEEQLQNLQILLNKCQQVAEAIQQTAHHKIAAIVTQCLNVVFDDPYEFEIVFERKRNKTEAHPIFRRNGCVIDDPVSASGGGVIDVASFALRLAAIILSRPSKRKLMVLDEPFKFVSKKYRQKISQVLHELCDGYGVQIIMVTHIDELKTGTICKI